MDPPLEGRISEVPASIFMTWPKSAPVPANSQTTSAKAAALKLNDDFTWGDMAQPKGNLSRPGNSYPVLQPEALKMQDHFFRSIGTFPWNFYFTLAVGENRKTVGGGFRLTRGHIGFHDPPKERPGVFYAYDHLFVLGMVLRDFYLQFFFADTLFRKQINRMSQKHVDMQSLLG